MKTYRGHNEAVQGLVAVTEQTLSQRTPETISDIGDHGVMTDQCITPEHFSGVTTTQCSHMKEIEKDRQTGSGDGSQTQSQSMAL